MITLTNISKSFVSHQNTTKALQNIDLSIEPGSWVSITGPSGSGKSTLANIISGIILPDQGGSCIIDGFDGLDHLDICQADDEKRSQIRCAEIAFIHQDFNLISYLNVLENIVLPDILCARKPDWDRAEKAAVSVGLTDKTGSMPDELSGGQQQRVAIARALYSRAQILIADEPTGNLDEVSRDEMIELFHSLHQKGMTLIIITHDHHLAGQGQKILHLEEGKFA